MVTHIHQKAMLVKLKIGMWGAETIDPNVTRQVTEQHSAAGDAGRWHKKLLQSPHLDLYRSLVSQARRYHKDQTLPWDDNSTRIMPVMLFDDYVEGANVIFRAMTEAAGALVDDYEDAIEREQKRQGTMFDVSDYPKANLVASRFYHDLSFWPIPKSDDFRITIDAEAEAEIKANVTNAVEARIEEAMSGLWRRLYETITALRDNLDQGSRLYDSYSENLIDLVDMLPAMNLTEDPHLAKLTGDLQLSLCANNMDDFRDDNKLREQAVGKANKALKAIEGFGAFQKAA